MTPPFMCVAIGFVLTLVAHLPVMVARWRLGYDNKQPRRQSVRLTGAGGRAWGAELNAIESFPPFAAAVCIAHLAGADPERAALLSWVWVGARVLHLVMYLADLDYLRSAVWFVGVLATGGLFVLAFVA
jgi:uncharacterized MAPEG superfamily protein